jgi:hypothetical protein
MSLNVVDINGSWLPSNIHNRFGCTANLCNDLRDNRGDDRRGVGWNDWNFLMCIVNNGLDRCGNYRRSRAKSLISLISEGGQVAALILGVAYILNFSFNVIGGTRLLQIVTPRRSGCHAHRA